MFAGRAVMGGLTERQALERRAGSLLRGMGYSEIFTYSFISPSVTERSACRPIPRSKTQRSS
jgi:phenylalanyl-tRNA synthetase beta chain